MVRTLVLAVPAAALTAWAWLTLEANRAPDLTLLWILALAILPALARTWRRRAAAALVSFVGATLYLANASLLDARPFDGQRDLVGPVFSRLGRGVLDFYDVAVPFDPGLHPRMDSVVLFAVLSFSLALALAIAARRPVAAAGALIGAVGWPLTLAPASNSEQIGIVAFALMLMFFALLRERGPSFAPQAVPLGGLLLVVAIAVSGLPAVAKGAFLNWQTWDPYTQPGNPASVRFVWNANYNGIRFPKEPTTVLKIKAPFVSLYWRATTLDNFDSDRWFETLRPLLPGVADAEPLDDPLLPARARDPESWIESSVTVEALEDHHLIGASIPVRYEVDDPDEVIYLSDGVAVRPDGVPPGFRYKVWSYAARPSLAQLARSPARYPAALSRHLVVRNRTNTAVPPFGAPNRETRMRRFFDANLDVRDYEPLYAQARRIAGAAESPYAAAVAIENWLRVTGGFSYDERPPIFTSVPPLVGFVSTSKRGYCQHFAGAMALMLRYLGIPARVAAGFTSGDYKDGTWTVADRDAHTWVEVWFDGLGWLPFDPTPGRGFLSATYSSSSPFFDIVGATAALGALAEAYDIRRDRNFRNPDGSRIGVNPVGLGADRPDTGGGVRGAASRGSQSLLALLVTVIGVSALILGLLKLARRRLRYLRRDPRAIAAACRRELAEFLADQRFETRPSATVADLCAQLRGELGIQADSFVAVATEARFGPAANAGRAARQARRELRRLVRTIRGELTVWERMRGLFSLRSLAPEQ